MTSVAIVAPVWLQNALLVLLHSAPDLKVMACTATVQVLLSLDLDRTPDLILLEADERSDRAQQQIRQIKSAWPTASSISLVEYNHQKKLMWSAGTDEVLLKGATPQQLMKAIRRLIRTDRDLPIEEEGDRP